LFIFYYGLILEFSGEHKPSADPRDTGIEREFNPNFTEAIDQKKDIGIAEGDIQVNTGTGVIRPSFSRK
jgi:hypothetical protein